MQRKELSFYQSETSEPSAPANEEDKDSSLPMNVTDLYAALRSLSFIHRKKNDV